MIKMDNNIASIVFRPICSKCKHLIYEEIDYIEYPIQINNYKKCLSNDYEIIPNKCPHCNTPFESIEIPTKLPFDWRTI